MAPSFSRLRRARWSHPPFPGNRCGSPRPNHQTGVYTFRYSIQPVDGAHVGVAPQRDFVLLTPIADDADPNALPGYDALVQMSKESVGYTAPRGALH